VSDGGDGAADSETPSQGWPARARAGVTSHPVTVAVASAVIVVVLTVALVLSLLALGNRDAVNGARSDALAAARTYSVELAGYDYRHLDRDFGTVLANSTPRFRRSFAQSSSALKATLTRYHATAVAKIVSSGLVSATTSRAVVLVFLNQRITNTLKTPSTDRSQVEITLVHTGGRWLIDDVSLL
jgi:Mce-associated membrane protein